MSTKPDDHVSADRLQALLDGALPSRERARVEEHLAACPRCSEELEGWRALFEDLKELPRHAPRQGFAGRVMASMELPAPRPLAARFGGALAALLRANRPVHPTGDRLQDFLDGTLPTGQLARVAAHLEECQACSREVDGWRAVYARLGGLGRFAPREGFADRVMAAVRLRVPAAAGAVPARAPTLAGLRLPDWRRALATVGRYVPKTRRAWATISGVAVTPAVTAGLVLYSVFSHPTITPHALASFAAWKLTDGFSAAWTAVGDLALDGAQVLGLDAVARTLLDAPLLLAGGALIYSAVSALALRVLHKNLSGSRGHARPSRS